MRGVAESLAGRVAVITMLGLSRQEMIGQGAALIPPFVPTASVLQARQALHQSASQQRPAEPPVAPHRYGALALAHGQGTESTTQGARHLCMYGGGHDASDIVGFENTGR
jgi:hypothetical protein